MKTNVAKNISLFIIGIAFILFVYVTYRAIVIVSKTQIGTSEGTYISYVTSAKEIEEKAKRITQECKNNACKVQELLNYVSNIPYATSTFQQNSPQKTIQENFGDCDDKSNLLISMLHALEIEAYFVLVPKHIFVIVPLDDERLNHKKGLWVNGRKYYILESTVKESEIGFPLHYRLDEIDVMIEPFSNTKVDIKDLKYKL